MVFRSFFSVLLLLSSAAHRSWVFVNADYYDHEVQWGTGCETGIDYCGQLEFCEDMSSPTIKYGYRLPGATVGCGTVNGPVIRMQPDKMYKLTLVNTATVETNLHTHGLHVVGSGNSDDPTRIVKAGECLDYVYDLTNHPPGTNWYHPHRKGTTDPQVKAGAFGMIVVEDLPNTGPGDWAVVQSNEKLVQLSTHGGLKANMNTNEVISIDTDRWYRLRLSMVVPSAFGGELYFSSTSGCKVFRVASDGVWHIKDFSTYTGTKYWLTGVGRADFALRCPSSETGSNYEVKWNGVKAFTIQPGNSNPDNISFDISDTGLGSAPPREESINLTEAHPDDMGNGLIKPSRIKTYDFNTMSWPANGLGTIVYDHVFEWLLLGTYHHPFHMHMYHMKIVQPGGCGRYHPEGEYFDTIQHDNPTAGCKIRFIPKDFGQKLWVHCHTLSHEDGGMMSYFNVDPFNRYFFPVNNVVSPSYSCPAAGPAITSAPTPAPVAPVPVINVTPICQTYGTNVFGGTVMNINYHGRSPNNRFLLLVQADGNMVHYDTGTSPWGVGFHTNTYGGLNTNSVLALMQDDGNFVLYRTNASGLTPIWHTHTFGHPGSFLAIQDDGNMVVYSPSCTPLWSMWHDT